MNTQRTCFIASGTDAATPLLREVLRDRWQVIVPSDAPVGSGSLVHAAELAMARADIVLGVLDGSAGDDGAIFELGLAAGLRKPIVVLAAPGLALPHHLNSVAVVRSAPEAADSLRFALDHAVRYGAPKARPAPIASRPLGSDEAGELLISLSQAKTESEMSPWIAKAIEASGATVVQDQAVPGNRGRFDIGVWSADIESTVGNPFLIEVKYRIDTGEQLRAAIRQVVGYLRATTATWGMVVYHDGPRSETFSALATDSPVLLLRGDELVEQMATRGFADVIRVLRNERVHGVNRRDL